MSAVFGGATIAKQRIVKTLHGYDVCGRVFEADRVSVRNFVVALIAGGLIFNHVRKNNQAPKNTLNVTYVDK